MKKKIIYIFLFLGAILLVYCNTDNSNQTPSSKYLNLQDSVAYMGMTTCQSCHANVHQTFIETGMGASFGKATKEKSGASFQEHDVVYDEQSDFYYKPYFEDDIMYVMEYRLSGKDTIHKRIEQIDYIVGSGHHTNSHIVEENGYFFQAPITFYTQEKRWDMAPGFDQENQRFSRFLTSECITCHNHLPKQVEGSLNKYAEMPTGIECERCHGPGEIHVKDKLAGNIIDTSKMIDYTIVNPADLPKDLLMDLCQRCHLQGIPVLTEGKSFYDFKPGMKLSEVMNVFLPRYTNSHEKFIMASQADRLRKSKCYELSEELTCLTCHHPHHSVLQTNTTQFNDACNNCHQKKALPECSAEETKRVAENDNCVKCHMPPSSSIDIPHIKITDHNISRITDFSERIISETDQNEIAQFIGLQMLTKDKPSNLEMAQGYIAMFDKNLSESAILDSAFQYLIKTPKTNNEEIRTWVHYYFSREDYRSIVEMAQEYTAQEISASWTAYRIGEAYFKLGDPFKALLFYKKAVSLSKYNLEFQEKLGVAYLSTGSFPQARQVFEFVLEENPKRPLALNNLGFVLVNLKQFEEGESFYDKALDLDPDYVQALLNKVAIRLYKNDKSSARGLLNRILKLEPSNPKAIELMQVL